MSRIIAFSHVALFSEGKTFGPSIRILEMSRALARKGHSVTLAEMGRKDKELLDGVVLVPWESIALSRIQEDFDAALIQIWSDDKALLDMLGRIPLVVDIYAPYMIEHAYLYSKDPSKENSRIFKYDILLSSLAPLLKGDMFICSTEEQKTFYFGMLTSLGRITPSTIGIDMIKVVPFGMRTEKFRSSSKDPFKTDKELKGKKIILWPGALYPWYDPQTLIDAMEILHEKHPDYALVILGARNPMAPAPLYEPFAEGAADYASSKGLLGKAIFFRDYAAYDDLPGIYAGSEFGVITHHPTIETRLSFRTRILDCLWGELPMVCTEGGYMSDLIDEHGLGLTVHHHDAKALATAMISLIKDKKKLAGMKRKVKMFVSRFPDWDTLCEPVSEFMLNPVRDTTKGNHAVFDMLEASRNEHYQMTEIIKEKDAKIVELRDSFKVLPQTQEELQKHVILLQKAGEENMRLSQLISQKDAMISNLGTEKIKDREIISSKDDLAAKLSQDITALRISIADRDSTLRSQAEEIMRLGKEISRSQAESAKLREERAGLKHEISARSAEADRLKRENTDLRSALARDEEGIRKMQSQLELMQSEIRDRDDAILILKEELSDERKSITDKERLLSIMENDIREMQDRINACTAELRDANAAIASLKDTLRRRDVAIGRYRASVVYPMYRLTSSIGDTSLGRLLQKLIK